MPSAEVNPNKKVEIRSLNNNINEHMSHLTRVYGGQSRRQPKGQDTSAPQSKDDGRLAQTQ